MKQKEANKEEKIKVEKQKNEKLSIKKQKNSKEETNTYKQLLPEVSKKVFTSILLAVGVIVYFVILNYTYSEISQESILNIIEICSGILLLTSLILFEIAYKKDNSTIAIIGIEFLVLAFHSLSIKHVITKYNYQFQFYLLTSSYIFAIYYILKAIIIYTKGRSDYLKTLSDIPEIVKKDEPVKKEAKKQSEKETNVKIEQKPKTAKKKGPRKKNVNKEKIEDKSKEEKTKKSTNKTTNKNKEKTDNQKSVKTRKNLLKKRK